MGTRPPSPPSSSSTGITVVTRRLAICSGLVYCRSLSRRSWTPCRCGSGVGMADRRRGSAALRSFGVGTRSARQAVVESEALRWYGFVCYDAGPAFDASDLLRPEELDQ